MRSLRHRILRCAKAALTRGTGVCVGSQWDTKVAELTIEGRVEGRRGALTVCGLKKTFGLVVAVDEVDLQLRAGEFVTLLGPSGSGKTTILVMLAGLERPDAGEVTLDGEDITYKPAHKRDIGVVFQNYALFPHMTVAENIAFPLKMRRMKYAEVQRRVSEAIELVRLFGLELRYPSQLSGGQQQRVAVARAVVYRPPVLLMDEPLSALDRNLREELQVEIRRLHRNLGTSFLYVTHDQGEALALSDRIVLMNRGRVEQVGSPSEVYQHPKTAFAARFLGQSNFVRGKVEGFGSDGTAVVRLRIGVCVRGVPSVPVERQQKVAVLVRPEHLNLLEFGPDREMTKTDEFSSLGMRVGDAMYLGETVRIRGTFMTGEDCVLQLRPDQASLLLSAGGGVVGWTPQRGVVIPDDEVRGGV